MSDFLELPPGTSIAPEPGIFKAYMGWPINNIATVRIVGSDVTGIVLKECVKTGHRQWGSRPTEKA